MQHPNKNIGFCNISKTFNVLPFSIVDYKKEIEKLLDLLKSVGVTRGKIEADLDYSENYIDQILAKGGNAKFVSNLKRYSDSILQNAIIKELKEPDGSYLKKRRDLKNSDNETVPVYVGSTRAGTIEVYSDDPSVNEPVAALPAKLFPGCNHAEKVNGSSMYPMINNQGFVIGKIIDKKGIIHGEIYVIHTKYGMSMVKYLHKAEQKDHVKLVSYSKQVPPQEIPYDDITFVCRIYFIVNPA